nr:CPARA 3gp389/Ycf20 [Cryptomonas curvata]
MILDFYRIFSISKYFFKSKKQYCIKVSKAESVYNKKFKKRSKNWKYYSKVYFCFIKFSQTNFWRNFFTNNIFYGKKIKIYSNLNWTWEISLGIFCILFGFFSATSAITIIGSVADWDPLAAAVMLCWTEFFTKIFYFNRVKSFNFKLINSFKIGINFGMFVDALKLTS